MHKKRVEDCFLKVKVGVTKFLVRAVKFFRKDKLEKRRQTFIKEERHMRAYMFKPEIFNKSMYNRIIRINESMDEEGTIEKPSTVTDTDVSDDDNEGLER